jgi:hypothetical protein
LEEYFVTSKAAEGRSLINFWAKVLSQLAVYLVASAWTAAHNFVEGQ